VLPSILQAFERDEELGMMQAAGLAPMEEEDESGSQPPA